MAVKKSVAPVSPISAPTASQIPPLKSRHALTVPQAAAYLSVSNWFVEEAVRNGLLPFRELNNGSNSSSRLLDADDLDSFLNTFAKQRVTEIVRGKAITEQAA